ncbi:hypothetical protein [Yeosuana sp. AK3]
MEEISWGQWFLHFNTPINWEKINMQGETTLHNLKGMQGNSELLRILFGVGGLLGIILRSEFNFKFIGAPKVLMTWFIIIIVQSVVDTFTNMNNIPINIDYAIQRISEFIELLIASSALIYLWMNFKFLTNHY